MAAFVENLWEAVFTPGPTPTLLIATNASFAALQLILGALLLATYSIHFVVLSFLCAGLWASINWFAREVIAAQAEADARKAKEGRVESLDGKGSTLLDRSGAVDSGDDTAAGKHGTEEHSASGSLKLLNEDQKDFGMNAGAASRLAPSNGVRWRRSLAESSGDVSTDSEWEKVDGE